MYYFLIFILLGMACFVSLASDGKDYIKPLYILLFFVFWLTAGLRYETGIDYFAYQDIYSHTNTLREASTYGEISDINVEPGYKLLNSIFRSLGVDINIMFLMISLITSILLFNSFEAYINDYKFFALLVYFSFVYFVLDMSGVRQAIAVNIFLYSLRFIYHRKFYKYLLCLFVACLFHASALIGILLYWLLNKKLSTVFMVLATIFGFIIIGLKIPVINLMVERILNQIMPYNVVYKLFYYSAINKVWGLNLKVVLNILILFVLLYHRKFLDLKYPYFNIILNSLFFYVFFRQVLWESIDINSRINFYFIIGLVMGVPLLMELVKQKANKIYVFLFIIFISFYQSNSNFLIRSAINPYQNYLFYEIFNLKSTGKERFLEDANKL